MKVDGLNKAEIMRRRRNDAELSFLILKSGIAERLQSAWDTDQVRLVAERVGDLLDACQKFEAARDAYAPYVRLNPRRRMRLVANPKKKKAKVA